MKEQIIRSYKRFKEKGYASWYWAIDVHDVIFVGDYKVDCGMKWVRDAKRALKIMAMIPEIKVILYTASQKEQTQKTIDKIKEIRERYKKIGLEDQGTKLNQVYVFAHQFEAMMELALVIAKGALLRNEFRGAHYKPDFPERDDKNWLKTTIAMYHKDEPEITYEPIDIRHLDPIQRDYTQAKKVKPQLKNIPSNVQLPL